MRATLALLISIALSSCYQSKEADLVVHNARIQSMDESMTVYQAMAIKDGKILELGPERQILNKYATDQRYDAGSKWVYPGFIDGHCHFLGYGLNKQKVDLQGTRSFEEVIEKVVRFAEANPDREWIIGRGWDQNDWVVKEYPTKDTLEKLFPDRPVLLQRVDGHAALVNNAAINKAGLDVTQQISGGQVLMSKGKFSGILIDNAVDVFQQIFNDADETTKRNALLRAQKDCFAVGLTCVHDAGLDLGTIELMQSMHASGELSMRIYAMAADNPENRNHFEQTGQLKTERLSVRALKVYADGSLGSRGAHLKAPYADQHDHSGLELHNREHVLAAAKWCKANNFQMASHCIGDSANSMVLGVYGEVLKGTNDLRWRIEHAQVVDPKDMIAFKTFNIIPSVQPTHATSDMYWAEERLGPQRINWAYSYKDLKAMNGILALGTDFPVEGISPLHTFHAAVERTDLEGYPEGGFRKDQGLTALEALRGITIDNATVAFMEGEVGSLEIGKYGDFIVLEQDLLKLSAPAYKLAVIRTYINGELVFSK